MQRIVFSKSSFARSRLHNTEIRILFLGSFSHAAGCLMNRLDGDGDDLTKGTELACLCFKGKRSKKSRQKGAHAHRAIGVAFFIVCLLLVLTTSFV